MGSRTTKDIGIQRLDKNPKTHDTWNTSYANKLGRLAQGIRNIPGTNCIFNTTYKSFLGKNSYIWSISGRL